MLLEEVNFSETKKNARRVLKNYRRLDRIAGRSLIDVRSPVITDMPKAEIYGNNTENALIQHIEAEYERDAILDALKALGLISRQILYYCYCVPEGYSNCKIGYEIGYSERHIERMKSEALIEFAEAYKKGKLISYR